MRRFAIFLTLLFGLLLAGVAIGYLYLPELVTAAASTALQRRGLELVELDLRRARWDRLEVRRLAVASGEGGWSAETGRVVVRYDWTELLHRRVNSVEVDSLRLELPHHGEKTDSDAFAWPPSPREVVQNLPFDRLALGEGTLHWSVAGEPLTARFAATLARDGGTLRIEATVEQGATPAVSLTGTLSSDDTFELNLYRKEQPPIVTLAGKVENETATGRLRADAARLLPLAGSYAQLPPWLDALEGTLALEWTVRASDAPTLSGELRLSAALPELPPLREVSLSLDGTITAGREGVTWTPADGTHLSSRVPFESGGVTQLLQCRLAPLPATPLRVRWRPEDSRVDTEGALLVGCGGSDAAPAVEAQLFDLALHGDEPRSLTGRAESTGSWKRPGVLPADSVAWSLAAGFEAGMERLRITPEPGGNVSLKEIAGDDWQLAEAALQLTEGGTLDVEFGEAVWRLSPTRLALSAKRFEVGAVTSGKGGGELLIERATGWGSKVASAGALRATGVHLTGLPIAPPPVDASAKWQLADDQLSAELGLGAGPRLKATGTLKQRLGGNGILTLRGEPLRFSPEQGLASLVAPIELPVELSAGNADWAAEWQWGGDGQASTRVNAGLSGLAGNFGENRFEGAAATLAVAGDAGGWRTAAPVPVSVARLDAGVTIEAIRAQLQAELPANTAPRLQLTDLRGRLLGGRMHSEAIAIDLSRERNLFVVKLDGVDLAQLMELERQEGLSGTGQLDGTLPFVLTSKGIRIDSGLVQAQAPGGRIAYQPDEAAQGVADWNPNIALAVEALSNYHYHLLRADVDYDEEGRLLVRLQLQGRNPDFNAGQPINLNVSVEENIPALLRSLRLADDISGAVEERVRRRYQE